MSWAFTRLRQTMFFGVVAIAALAACAQTSAPPTQSTGVVQGPATTGTGDFLGCPYPSGDVYQTNIVGAPLAPNSAAYVAAISLASPYPGDPPVDGGFQAWVSTQQFNSADNSTPQVLVEPGNSYDSPISPIPWLASFFIEKDGDHHAEVVNTQSCQYYEGYKTYKLSPRTAISMYNNEKIDLTAPFVRPSTGALSTATGIPLGLLAVRPEELTAGVISHAIGWNAQEGTLNGMTGAPCVSPAGKIHCTDGNVYNGPASAIPMPYGSHARLKATFSISGFSHNALIVAVAMRQYGLYVYDTGCCNAIILANDQYGAPNWTSSDVSSLAKIKPSDFEIVQPPSDGSNDEKHVKGVRKTQK